MVQLTAGEMGATREPKTTVRMLLSKAASRASPEPLICRQVTSKERSCSRDSLWTPSVSDSLAIATWLR